MIEVHCSHYSDTNTVACLRRCVCRLVMIEVHCSHYSDTNTVACLRRCICRPVLIGYSSTVGQKVVKNSVLYQAEDGWDITAVH